MKKLLLFLLLLPLAARGAAPQYDANYPLTNKSILIGLGSGKLGATNSAAVKVILGITDSAGVYPNTTQLDTNSSTALLSIISDSTQTNTVEYSGSAGSAKTSADMELRRLYKSNGTSYMVDWENGLLINTTTSLDWVGRKLYDFGLDPSIDYLNRVLFNETGGTNIDYRSSYLKDTSNQRSVEYTTRILDDSSGGSSLDWNNRVAYNSTGDSAIDWESGYLQDNSGVVSLDWKNRVFADTSANTSVDYQNRLIVDSFANNSANWQTRKLIDSGGVTTSIDWDARVAYDAVGGVSLSYGARTLKDATATTSVDWDNRQLKRADTTLSADWAVSKFYSSTGVTDPTLDWSLRAFTGSGWKFLTATNHTDVSAGAYAIGNIWRLNASKVWTNGPPGWTAAETISGTFDPARLGSLSNHTDVAATANTLGGFLRWSGTIWTNGLILITNAVGGGFDGSGAVIAAGTKAYASVDKAGTIYEWEIIANGSSPTCTIDVWKIAAGTAIPTIANTIMGTKPALASGNVLRSSTTTGWTTLALAKGDILVFNVDACTVATQLQFKLAYTTQQ